MVHTVCARHRCRGHAMLHAGCVTKLSHKHKKFYAREALLVIGYFRGLFSKPLGTTKVMCLIGSFFSQRKMRPTACLVACGTTKRKHFSVELVLLWFFYLSCSGFYIPNCVVTCAESGHACGKRPIFCPKRVSSPCFACTKNCYP